MTYKDLFEESYSALTANMVRTGLTMLGIVIGIGSVIAMVSIGQGAQGSIESSIQSIGSDLIIVMPGFQRNSGSSVRAARGSAQTLTQGDADAIAAQIASVKAVAPDSSGRYQVIAKGNNTNTSVDGVTTDYPTVRNITIEMGAFFSGQQLKSSAKVAVLGPSARDDLFGENVNPVGQTIKISNMEFKVIGVTKSKGSSGMNSSDDMIYVPLTTQQRYLSGSEYLSTISVQAESADTMSQIQTDITNLLLERHKITDSSSADFSVMNQSDIVAAASSVTGTFTMLLAAIAGISLVVGGIGIMNMMLTTVTERTKEIGLRKAIGATSSDISSQFLMESIIITLIGGIVGIAFGWVVSLIIAKFASLSTTVSWSAVGLAFGVSAVIGLIFGYYPAKRAAKLNPIEALRFE